jgi:hypothetical protein
MPTRRRIHGPRADEQLVQAERLLTMRDLIDGQLESVDGRRLARAADAEADWREDGSLWVTDLLVGPEAHLGRIGGGFRRLGHRLFRGRFEHRIPIGEVEELGPTVRLAGRSDRYPLQGMDEWIIRRILRFIPGNGS